MTSAECQVETYKHIEKVREYIQTFIIKLYARGLEHDRTKLEEPELEVFTKYTPKLSELTYDSQEYKECLEKMNGALQHHYAQYRHHPEHFEHGVEDMTLIDLVEMFCDWKAASERQLNGNLLKSIEKNAERFNINSQLKRILSNTAKAYDELK